MRSAMSADSGAFRQPNSVLETKSGPDDNQSYRDERKDMRRLGHIADCRPDWMRCLCVMTVKRALHALGMALQSDTTAGHPPWQRPRARACAWGRVLL